MKYMKETNKFVLGSLLMIAFLIVVSYVWLTEHYTERENLENDKIGRIEENEKVVEEMKFMPKIIDIIIEDDNCTALCEDGSVWAWENIYERRNLHKIPNLNFIVKILDAGSAMYALSLNGDVYTWGSNLGRQIDVKEDSRMTFYEPIKYLSGISDIEAKNGKLFAISQDGRFYMRGVDTGQKDYETGFPLEYVDLVENVKQLPEGGWGIIIL